MPLSSLRLAGTVVLMAGLLAACSGDLELADPTAETTRAEQARLVKLLATDLPGEAWTPATCKVTVLRKQTPTTWASVACTVAPADNGGVEGSWGAPIRVDGDTVIVPRDGSEYPVSIRETFPSDLAEYVLTHQGKP